MWFFYAYETLRRGFLSNCVHHSTGNRLTLCGVFVLQSAVEYGILRLSFLLREEGMMEHGENQADGHGEQLPLRNLQNRGYLCGGHPLPTHLP